MAQPAKLLAKTIEVKQYGSSVYEYTFQPQGRVPRFHAGQFLHLALDAYDPSFEWPESRVFSIASGNKDRTHIKVVISVKGEFTTRMVNEIKPGTEVWLKFPYGEFIIDRNDGNKQVLIAGGTGVAPFVSYVESVKNSDDLKGISLYYGVRDAEQLLFEKTLSTAEQKGLELHIFNENNANDKLAIATEGALEIAYIYQQHGSDAIYYLSGPWAMIESFEKKLISFGINKDNIRIDAW